MSEESLSLESLSPSTGSKKTARRIGRGNASGWGRTAARGEKGQKSRAGGGTRPGFEGGQMPLYRRIPKFGFVSRKKIFGLNAYKVIDLDALEKFEDGAVVDLEALAGKGLKAGAKEKKGIKVLGSGKLTKKLQLKVNATTKSAKAKIEELGGTVELV